MTPHLLPFLVAATLLPGLAQASDGTEPPARYVQDRWNHTRDTATIGGVVGALGVATAATGVAFRDEASVPSGLLISTGAAAAASGATVMSIVGLQQRYEFLDRSNSPLGGYLSLGLVGLSGIGLVGSLATTADSEVHDTLLYGSAAVGGTALIPAAMQLTGNAGRMRQTLAWAPMVTPDKVGAVAMVRW